jgi:hypothetical protein
MTNRPDFPTAVDSTLLSTFRSCPQKFFLEYMQHWRFRTPNVHLHAGAAFAKGLEVARDAFWTQGADEHKSRLMGRCALAEAYGDFEAPSGSAKTLDRMLGAFDHYMERFPLPGTEPVLLPSGRRAIEFSFVQPLPVTHPVTNEPILYSGRLDQIINWQGGIYLEDDKTTSSLGASWGKQWELRSQFTGYAWGIAEATGIQVTGALVRGVSILKTKYDTAECVTYRPEWQIDRWFDQVLRDLTRMKKMWAEGYWDYNLDHACGEFGGCQFLQVCQMRDPSDLLSLHFERRKWDPVARTETLLDE